MLNAKLRVDVIYLLLIIRGNPLSSVITEPILSRDF